MIKFILRNNLYLTAVLDVIFAAYVAVNWPSNVSPFVRGLGD
jgi:hypothetical protein